MSEHEAFDDLTNRIPFIPRPNRLDSDCCGHLLIDGVDANELAQHFMTPLYVFSEQTLRSNYRTMRQVFDKHYPNSKICFAYKSNSLLGVLRVFREEGAWADVVSGGEYFKAQKAGVEPENIVFNGNNKLRSELKTAIENGSLINADSIHELRMIEETARSAGKKARISIRVNADVSSNVIPEFSTALKSSKFGVDLDGDAYPAYRFAVESQWIDVLGIHSHIGSQIENSQCYMYAATRIMDFVGRLKRELGLDLTYVNMGGGYGIPFDYLTDFVGVEEFASAIAEIIQIKVAEYGLKAPTLLVEPGGSLCGTAAVTLFKVGTIKEKPGKKLAALDGGSDTLLRATQGWYTYRVLCAGKMNRPADGVYDLVGPLCYEGDVTARGRKLPTLEENDVVAYLDTGAYTASLANNYNGRRLPAAVMISAQGEVRLIRRRQSLEELLLGEE